MLKGYQPQKPVIIDEMTAWANKLHEIAFNKRAMKISAGGLTKRTSAGQTLRRK